MTERLELPETGQVFHAGTRGRRGQHLGARASDDPAPRAHIVVGEAPAGRRHRPATRSRSATSAGAVEEIVEDPVNRRGHVVLTLDR